MVDLLKEDNRHKQAEIDHLHSALAKQADIASMQGKIITTRIETMKQLMEDNAEQDA
jgi:hypothetical protein